MKTHYVYLTMLLVLSCCFQTQAQFQAGLHYTYAVNVPKVTGTNIFRGGGVLVRYFLSPKLALGASAYTVSGEQRAAGITFVINQRPITAMIEYYLTRQGVRPYVGVNGGVYTATVKPKDATANAGTASSSSGCVAPKIGLQIPITSGVRLFGEGAYTVVFNKDASQPNQLVADAKYVAINGGVLVSFGTK